MPAVVDPVLSCDPPLSPSSPSVHGDPKEPVASVVDGGEEARDVAAVEDDSPRTMHSPPSASMPVQPFDATAPLLVELARLVLWKWAGAEGGDAALTRSAAGGGSAAHGAGESI